MPRVLFEDKRQYSLPDLLFIWKQIACLCEGRRPGVARQASNFLSLARQESHQRKGDPTVCDPCAALRGNLGCSVTGCTAELAARLRRSARTTAVSQFTKHARSDAHATPRPARPWRIQKKTRESDIHPGHRFARPHLAGACATRCAGGAERSNGPCGCSAVGCSDVQPPAGCACGGAVAG